MTLPSPLLLRTGRKHRGQYNGHLGPPQNNTFGVITRQALYDIAQEPGQLP